MKFNYGNLLGKMKQHGIRQEDLAKLIGNTPATLSLKLNNKANFKQSEIIKICETLNIDCEDIGSYFFAC